MKVLVCGAGKMVEAILEGLQNEMDLSQFYIYSPSGKSAQELAKKVGAQFVAAPSDVKDVSWVWIGCKPQQLGDLAKTLKGLFMQATFVSMLAALPEADQMKTMGINKLIRIMPNQPVKYKKGVTLISSFSAQADIHRVKTLFSLVGLAQEVKENELEELTLLTGSGPAFFYEFARDLGASFSSLTDSERENLARMVLQGAGVSSAQSEESLTTMINSVTSKAGVTIAVLEKWRVLNLKQLIREGVRRGKERSKEIKDSLLRS
jgi:pyrroline-5-carboxylate reductase